MHKTSAFKHKDLVWARTEKSFWPGRIAPDAVTERLREDRNRDGLGVLLFGDSLTYELVAEEDLLGYEENYERMVSGDVSEDFVAAVKMAKDDVEDPELHTAPRKRKSSIMSLMRESLSKRRPSFAEAQEGRRSRRSSIDNRTRHDSKELVENEAKVVAKEEPADVEEAEPRASPSALSEDRRATAGENGASPDVPVEEQGPAEIIYTQEAVIVGMSSEQGEEPLTPENESAEELKGESPEDTIEGEQHPVEASNPDSQLCVDGGGIANNVVGDPEAGKNVDF
jgi:hypothetical protein